MDSDVLTNVVASITATTTNQSHDAEEAARAKIAVKAAHIERCIREAGYDPDTYRPDWNALLPAFMACVARHARGILLRGGTGCGKTTFLRAVQRVCRPGGVHYIDCQQAATLEYLDWPETPAILARNAFVLLDDMGTDEVAHVYGERRDRIARLILDWDRWPAQFGTNSAMLIVATNLTGSQINERYGDRITSRLCNLKFVLLNAPDARMQRHMETTP